ncbi:Protein FAR1-RELATED SEQUENCE 4 [Acorus calamus]|uniref:Protein FAR1-RELATED SEQUENCE 4 n=1 Tax=Acorus calamus TaxID=4465 RepID=A0AAV9D5V2_ACOCL|nr:Protein FAR1-RELATED SEQUENCE 4 [Acorus calamus]
MDKQLHFQVLFNAVSEEVSCLCRSFEFRGILCRHALCVLRSEFITEIPKKYILNRWRKDCKRLHSSSTSSHTNFVINRPVNLFDKLFNIGFQHLLEIAEIGSLSQDRYDSTLKLFSEMKTKLLSYDSTGVDLHTSGLTSSGGSSFTTAINDVECSPLPNKELDPQSVRAKCCPSVNGRALRCENACEKENNDLVVGHVATNEDEKLVSVLDTTELFITSMIFNYREEMINWAKKVGRDNGIVIVVSKSDYSDRRSPRLYLGCERGGQYRGHRACSPPKRKREKSTKRCGCPFKLKCTKLTALEDKWMIKVLDGTHNHPLIKNAEGRSFGGRLLNEEYEILRDLTKNGVRPRDILLHLKNRDSSNASTLTTIYNARAKMKKEEIGGHSNELFKRLFLSLDPGCEGCIFIQMNRRTGDPTPSDIVQHMMSSAASIRKQMSRFILRILPVEVASYASEEEISNAIKPLVARHFPTEAPTPKKFAVLYEAHATTGIDRMAIINSVVMTVPEPHKLDHDNPDMTIIVQVVKTICLVGVVEKYKEHLKYNLRQLTSPEP